MVLAVSNLVQADVGNGCGRGLLIDASCIWRWVQVFGPEFDKRCRRHLKPTNRSCRLDETYINVKGRDRFLYRAVDSTGQTVPLPKSAGAKECVVDGLITQRTTGQ
jgi:hypothetical protein